MVCKPDTELIRFTSRLQNVFREPPATSLLLSRLLVFFISWCFNDLFSMACDNRGGSLTIGWRRCRTLLLSTWGYLSTQWPSCLPPLTMIHSGRLPADQEELAPSPSPKGDWLSLRYAGHTSVSDLLGYLSSKCNMENWDQPLTQSRPQSGKFVHIMGNFLASGKFRVRPYPESCDTVKQYMCTQNVQYIYT